MDWPSQRKGKLRRRAEQNCAHTVRLQPAARCTGYRILSVRSVPARISAVRKCLSIQVMLSPRWARLSRCAPPLRANFAALTYLKSRTGIRFPGCFLQGRLVRQGTGAGDALREGSCLVRAELPRDEAGWALCEGPHLVCAEPHVMRSYHVLCQCPEAFVNVLTHKWCCVIDLTQQCITPKVLLPELLAL